MVKLPSAVDPLALVARTTHVYVPDEKSDDAESLGVPHNELPDIVIPGMDPLTAEYVNAALMEEAVTTR